MDTETHTARLPLTIRAFLEAQEARDADAALALLTPQAVIVDVGESFRGDEGLRRFVTETPRYMHFDIYGWCPTPAPGRSKGGALQGARALFQAMPELLAK